MKNLFIIAGLLLTVAALEIGAAETKTRYFDSAGMPLPAGKTGPYSLVCESNQQWNDSGCPPNLVLENGAVRLKTKEEKKADSDRADAEAKAKHKETQQGKLEARIEALEAEIEKLKKK